MKIILALFLITGMILIPGTAFGWKSISYEKQYCSIECSTSIQGIDHAAPMNFILLGFFSVIGLGIFYKISKTGKFDVFTLNCDECGRKTNGLKCPYCQATNQRL